MGLSPDEDAGSKRRTVSESLGYINICYIIVTSSRFFFTFCKILQKTKHNLNLTGIFKFDYFRSPYTGNRSIKEVAENDKVYYTRAYYSRI